MKKPDLRNGMIVKTTTGEIGIVLKGVNTRYGICDIVKFKNSFAKFSEFDENLNGDDYSIVEVYDINFWGADINELFDIQNASMKRAIIWKKEIDWTKVPKWTKVQVKVDKDGVWKNRYFMGKENKFFLATGRDEFTYEGYHCSLFYQCRLHESVKPKEEWYKKN